MRTKRSPNQPEIAIKKLTRNASTHCIRVHRTNQLQMPPRKKEEKPRLPVPLRSDHVAALSRMGFSLSVRGRRMASWLVILRPKALSTLAPNANLLRFSDFSGVGWYLCCCSRLLLSRSRPCDHSLISWMRGSPVVEEEVMVFSDAASDGGTPL